MAENSVEIGCNLSLVAAGVGPHLEVLRHRHAAEDAAPFGRLANSELDQAMGRHRRHVHAFELYSARLGMHQPADGLEGRGLAGAVATEHGHDLAAPNLERDTLQGFDPAVGGVNVKEAQQGRARIDRGRAAQAWRSGPPEPHVAPFPR